MEKNEKLHELILQVVDNQLAEGKPESTVRAYEIFRAIGYQDPQAKDLIASALLQEMHEMMVNGGEFNEERYCDALLQMICGDLYPAEEEIPEHLMLKDALLMNGDDLLDMLADEYAVIPGEDAEETAEAIAAYLLKPAKMKRMILALREGTVEAVEKIIRDPSVELSDEDRDLLTDCGDLEDCLYYADDGRILVPEDVAAVWKKVHTRKFENRRKKYVWLRSCLEAAAYYYGIFDMNVLMRLVGQDDALKMEKDEVYDLLDEMPEAENLFVRMGNQFVERDIADEKSRRALEKIQGNYPFMIPSGQEIRDIGFYHYPYHDKGWTDMRNLIKGTEFDYIADDVLPILFHRMTIEDDEEDVEDIMEEEHIMPANEDLFSRIWTVLYRNTRLLALRGGTRAEGKQPVPVKGILYDTLLNIEDRIDGEDPDDENEDMPRLFS